MFTNIVGLTIYDYVQRRQLTEVAKLLVFSTKSIIEIAALAGYEMFHSKEIDQWRVYIAMEEDIPAWMDLVRLAKL